MKKRENFVGKINAYLNTVLENIQVVTIILAAVMVTLDVLMRALFSKPISGTSE